METAQLYNGLTFLSYATGVIVILVGVMLAKVLFDLSKLTKNIDETTTIVKTELHRCRRTRRTGHIRQIRPELGRHTEAG